MSIMAAVTPIRPGADTLPAVDPHRADLDEVLARTGCSYRQLDYWTRVGILRPDDASPGSGHQRRWPWVEVAVAATMRALVDDGITMRVAADIARAAVEDGVTEHIQPSGTRIVVPTLDPMEP